MAKTRFKTYFEEHKELPYDIAKIIVDTTLSIVCMPCIIVVLCLGPFPRKCGGVHKTREDRAMDKRAEKNMKKFDARAEKLKRRRSLLEITQPVIQGTFKSQGVAQIFKRWNRQGFCDQMQSPIFRKLPIEIRMIIWRFTLCSPGGIGIRYNEKTGRLQSHPCYSTHDALPSHHRCQARSVRYISILLCCRLAYKETLDILYAYNPFTFDQEASLLVFSKLVPDSHWKRIQGLEINVFNFGVFNYYWGRRCESMVFEISKIVSKMTDLKFLHMTIQSQPSITMMSLRIEDTTSSTIDHLASELADIREGVPSACHIFVYIEDRRNSRMWYITEVLSSDSGRYVATLYFERNPWDPTPDLSRNEYIGFSIES